MLEKSTPNLPLWSKVFPILGVTAIFSQSLFSGVLAFGLCAIMLACVFCAVYHAEVIAHKAGEPYGTLILALSVTVIEVALIVSIMVDDPSKNTLPRDAVFSVIMIVCNILIGICLLLGGARHHEQGFHPKSASAFLAVLIVMATFVLILPNFTVSEKLGIFTNHQLVVVSILVFTLYMFFLFIQTLRHRDFFLPSTSNKPNDHVEPPTIKKTLQSFFFLILSLVSVVLLAKALTPALTERLMEYNAPVALIGVLIAAVILLPESLAAIRAARKNRLQASLNLSLGSVIASIGFTVPAVAVVSLYFGVPLIFGLNNVEILLLALTFLVSTITLSTGRTTMLQGGVHLSIGFLWFYFIFIP